MAKYAELTPSEPGREAEGKGKHDPFAFNGLGRLEFVVTVAEVDEDWSRF